MDWILDTRHRHLLLFGFVTSDSTTFGVKRLNRLSVIEHCKRKALDYRARPLIDFGKGTCMPGTRDWVYFGKGYKALRPEERV